MRCFSLQYHTQILHRYYILSTGRNDHCSPTCKVKKNRPNQNASFLIIISYVCKECSKLVLNTKLILFNPIYHNLSCVVSQVVFRTGIWQTSPAFASKSHHCLYLLNPEYYQWSLWCSTLQPGTTDTLYITLYSTQGSTTCHVNLHD